MLKAPVHRKIYLVLLTLLGGCMVTSVGMANVVWVLLLANWLLEGRWHEKWQMARESRLLHATMAFFLLHVVGLLWTTDTAAGFHTVERLLPWLAVPLVVLTTRPPQGRVRHTILALYVGTVVVVTVIGLVRWLTIPDLPYRDIVPYISHIRFALNCCMVIFFLLFPDITPRMGEGNRCPWWENALRVLLIAWMVAFLLLLRSYTALVVLAIAPLAMLFFLRHKWIWLTLWLAAVGVIASVVTMGIRDYYRMVPQATEPLREATANGRLYDHKLDGFVESGNYVNNYLCFEELEREWPRRSDVSLDSLTSSGYYVKAALVRYLNALGLAKDSAGVAALTDNQVAEIGRGVPNPVYEHGSIPKKMLHVTLFEFENYRCFRAVEGFSMLQRFELWKAAVQIIGCHPWLGVGTGGLGTEMERVFCETQSPMQGSELLPHNEYLTLTAQFGIPLVVLMALLFLRASPALRRQGPLMAAWLAAILLSFLTENTLDSLAGILFCTYFMAFRKQQCTNIIH